MERLICGVAGSLVSHYDCNESDRWLVIRCILGEMFKRRPILMGESDLGQLEAIFQLCGGPSEGNWPGWKSLPGCEGYQVRVDYQRKFNQYFSM